MVVTQSLDALALIVDLGPVPEDVVCADIGAIHGVDLVFNGEISAEDVDARIVDQ